MSIICIDHKFLGTPEVIASYLLKGSQGNVLIETGPATTQPILEAEILRLGISLDSIKDVLVTHIHLDHAGGAGYWARRGAKIYVHPKGAPHLIDPSRLLASASRIYKERMDELWGTTLASDPKLVVEVSEGEFEVAGLKFKAWDTPGHAAHHLAFALGDDVFTGDVAGVRLPGSDYVSVPAPPPEFNLESWLQSIEKLMTSGAKRLFLTHFGGGFESMHHLRQLKVRLRECVDFVRAHSELTLPELTHAYQAWDREFAGEQGLDAPHYAAYEKANPVFMSTQGITRYLKKLQST